MRLLSGAERQSWWEIVRVNPKVFYGKWCVPLLIWNIYILYCKVLVLKTLSHYLHHGGTSTCSYFSPELHLILFDCISVLCQGDVDVNLLCWHNFLSTYFIQSLMILDDFLEFRQIFKIKVKPLFAFCSVLRCSNVGSSLKVKDTALWLQDCWF